MEHIAFYQVRVLENISQPILFTVHGLMDDSLSQMRSSQELLNMSAHVSVVSQFLKQDLLSKKVPYNKPYHVIMNRLADYVKSLRVLSLNPVKLLIVSRLTYEKGVDVAFQAMHVLMKKYPQLHLTVVGGGTEFEKLSLLKESLGLSKNIAMLGWVNPEKVVDYIDEASCVLVPSIYESFSLVALQAAMRGRTVVASRVGGLQEVVEDKVTGLLVEKNSANALAEAMDYLLQNPEGMVRMGNAAYERAKKLFSIEKSAKQYLSLYQECIKDKACQRLSSV